MSTEIPYIDVVIFHSPCMDGTAGAYAVKVHNDFNSFSNRKLYGGEAPWVATEFFGTKPGLKEYNFPDVTGKSVA